MPGPGGGSHGGGGARGGGGFSGGGFSGGSHGGGFNGGFNHHPGGGHHHGPHFGGGWHRRRYYGGGGCSGGLFIVVIIVLMGIFALISSNNTVITETVDLSVERYDENLLQDYANAQYKKEFGKTSAYEDNILLVFLVDDETYYDYYYIAWVGDHIDTSINWMFGDENTELGQYINSAINTSSYKYSLDSNISQVVEYMKRDILSINLESSFICDEDNAGYISHLTNNTMIEMTEETVNSALQSFTEETGIPIVVVVEDIEDVFVTVQDESPEQENVQPQTESVNSFDFEFSNTFFIIIAVIAVVALSVVFIIRDKKKMQNLENDE